MTDRPASPASPSAPESSVAPGGAPEEIPAVSVPWHRGVLSGLGIAVPVLALTMIALVLSTVLGGFEHLPATVAGGLGAQLWLLSLGVPVDVLIAPAEGLGAEGGVVSLVPLGLSALTAWLSFAVGVRMARGAPSGARLGAAVLTAGLTHAVLAAAVAVVGRTPASTASPLWALLIGGWLVCLFIAIGAMVEEGSAAALVGQRTVARAQRMRQDYRWAGSYLWALLRAGGIGALCAVLAGAVCMLLALATGAESMLEAHLALGTDIPGDIAVAVLHFALLPNLVLWASAWASGAGFAIGDGTAITPAGTQAEALPMLPVLAILPGHDPVPALLAAPVLLVLGGFAAGHWFAREGEDHLGEWIAVRLPSRWLSAPLVIVLSSVLIGAVAGALMLLLGAVSSGSLGLGALTEVGPDPARLALAVGLEVALGALIALILSPWTDHRRAVRMGAAAAEPEAGAAEDDELWSVQGEDERARQEAASRAEADRQREARRRAEIKQRRRQRAEAVQAKRQRRESADERRRRRRKAVRDR